MLEFCRRCQFVMFVSTPRRRCSTSRTASSVAFRAPFEALPGVWLFRRTETEAVVEGRVFRLVSRFDKFEVNGPLPASLFDPKAFF